MDQNTQPITTLADELISTLTDKPIRPEIKERLQQAIEKRIQTRVLAVMLDNLSEEALVKVEPQIKPETPPEEALELLAANIPDFSDKLIIALDDLYNEISNDFKALQDTFDRALQSSNR